MSKVFKKYRIESIKSLKLVKYLIYSIGEVLIVVLGIIIAIYLNNTNEEKGKRNLINKVFVDVNFQTNKYIKNSVFFIDFNSQRDSLIQKIFNNKVQINDYKAGGYNYFYILRSITDFNFDFPFLGSLKENTDYLNEKEKVIYNELVELNSKQDGIKPFLKIVYETLQHYRKYETENLEWYYLALNGDSTAIKKELDFRQKSYRYKNFVADFSRNEIVTKSNLYSNYQSLALRISLKVAELKLKTKLKPNHIDSIFSNNNIKRITKINCEKNFQQRNGDYKMFTGTNMSNLIYNASQDVIIVKNEESGNEVGKLLPNKSLTAKESIGTIFGLYLNNDCVGKYKTEINSYILYE
jgi:hypothetical protein